MAARKQLSAGAVLSTLLLIMTSGCGQQSLPDATAPTAHPAVGFDEAAPPVERETASAATTLPPDGVRIDDVLHETVARGEASLVRQQPLRILTAGSLDDVGNNDEFRSYVAGMRRDHAAALCDSLGNWDGSRIEIMVRNSQGEPVQDAIVRVFSVSGGGSEIPLKYQPDVPNSTGQELTATVRTGSDGRTLFLPGIDDGDRYDELWTVEILSGDGDLLVHQEGLQRPAPDAWWDFAVGNQRSCLPEQLDLALVIDTTGSMGDELEYLKLEISGIAARVDQLFPGIHQRYALILYRDYGDRYVTRHYDFSDSLADFQQVLNQQHAGGGGDYPEAMHVALEQAGDLSWRERDTARVMFLVGDAPPHARHHERTFVAVKKLRDRHVSIFPVAGSGTRDEAEFVFRSAACMTGGQYLFLTDHSGIGRPHATPHAADYNVEWLSAVMLRMIASELSGRDVLPSEILATEGSSAPLLSQARQRYPHIHIPRTQGRMSVSFLNADLWDEYRPLIALVLLVILAMTERCFARRPSRHQHRHRQTAGSR